MKKAMLFLFTALVLLLPATALAKDQKDYPVAVHVYRTENSGVSGPYGATIILYATIDGHKYSLASRFHTAKGWIMHTEVVKIGDYNARVVKDESVDAARYVRTYEFLLSDGKMLEFDVTGESEN